MEIRKVKYFLGLIALLIISACAQINPLTGGEKDTYAPKIDSSGTKPLSGQINFRGDEIVIKFQEYVSLNNPNDNIIITPQLKEKPTIAVKNKKLTIGFNEQLADNTTYTINFNHAVTDITEKNDSIFQFVFSTGDYIDSLTLEGRVIDAFTNQPVSGYLVGLYPVSAAIGFDTLPATTKPTYFAQTNDAGKFKMNYLKDGEYFILAIDDKNRNLKWDAQENIAFYESQSIALYENKSGVDMNAFLESSNEVKLQQTKFTHPGRVELIFNAPVDSFAFTSTLDLLSEDTGVKDSLVFWTAKSPVPKMRFFVNLNNELDTLKPLYKGLPAVGGQVSLTFTDNLRRGKLLPASKFEITVSEPIESIDLSRVHFLAKDSSEIDFTSYSIQNVRTMVIDSLPVNFEFLKLDSGAIGTVYKNVNELEKWWSFEQLKPDFFGSLTLNVDTVFAVPVIVELLNEKNEVIRIQNFENKMEFKDLVPGKYQVRLIFDVNKDGVWTTGSFSDLRMPEKVLYNKELIDIKSRWEKEVDWIIGN